MDQMIISCYWLHLRISSHQFTTFCWLHEVTCPSTLARVTSHGIYDCQVNSKWCCNCELKRCFRIMSTEGMSAIWCNRSFPSVKCVWSTVWWSHVLRKLAHVYSPPCKSAGAKRWGMRGQAWSSWFDWLNLHDSTRRISKHENHRFYVAWPQGF